MNQEYFTKQIRVAQARASQLQQRAQETPSALLLEMTEELRTSLEELQTADEELRQRNEELLEMYQAVEAERQRYQDLFQFAPDGYLVTDPNGTIREANAAAFRLLNRGSKGLKGKPLVLFISPGESEIFYAELKRACQENRAQEWTLPLQPRHDGSQRPLHVAVTVAPVRGADGKVTAVRWLLRDITERFEAEERIQALNAKLEQRVRERTRQLEAANQAKDELLASERAARAEAEAAKQRLAFLAEASSVLASSLDYEATLANVAQLAVPHLADWCAVYILKEDGSIAPLAVAHIDPAKVELARELTRRYPEDPNAVEGIPKVIRTGCSEIYPEIPDALLTAVARDADHLRILRELGLKSGIQVPLTVHGRTLGALALVSTQEGRRYGPDDLDLAEELARRAAVRIDHARMYQELVDADKRKNEFLAMLGHELRNPLSPILSALQILRQPDTDSSVAEWSRKVIERQVQHMARLVDDLLDVSRITRGKIELRMEPVDLLAVVARAVEASRPLIEKNGHELTPSLPPEPVPLRGDPTRLEQVICNLLNNAAKYTPPGGRIWLTVEREGNEAVLRVRDNGMGIRPEMLTRVFDLFVQTERGLDRAMGGLGIGLTLVRSLVELHGGKVQAFSAGLGEGTEMVVRLPVLPALPKEQPAAAQPSARSTDVLSVLVVDDNLDSARTLAMLLRLWGHEVYLASDGPSALKLADAYQPDVVLLDIGLPEMDGYEVAQELRKRPGMAKALLIALTGYGQEEDKRRSQQAGFNKHLVKPIDPDVVQKLIAEFQART
jgi:PAS domain S-box-containing protein